MTMIRDLTSDEVIKLEGLVDASSLQGVLMALSEICGEKAEHIRTNWQDRGLARQWDTACGAIGCIVPKVGNL
jgi:hypothetical protein